MKQVKGYVYEYEAGDIVSMPAPGLIKELDEMMKTKKLNLKTIYEVKQYILTPYYNDLVKVERLNEMKKKKMERKE